MITTEDIRNLFFNYLFIIRERRKVFQQYHNIVLYAGYEKPRAKNSYLKGNSLLSFVLRFTRPFASRVLSPLFLFTYLWILNLWVRFSFVEIFVGVVHPLLISLSSPMYLHLPLWFGFVRRMMRNNLGCVQNALRTCQLTFLMTSTDHVEIEFGISK